MRKNSEASLLTVEGNRLIIRPLNRIHPRPAAEMKYPLRIVPQDLKLHRLSVDLCIVLKKVYQKSVNKMSVISYKRIMRLESAVLREYFSGVPLSSLTRRYGVNGRRIEAMASDYMKGKIDIFDPRDKKAIEMSKLSHKEEVRLLKEKIAILEDALKMANIKAEGADIMMGILKDEYGIDLSKKVDAERSRSSRGGTKK